MSSTRPPKRPTINWHARRDWGLALLWLEAGNCFRFASAVVYDVGQLIPADSYVEQKKDCKRGKKQMIRLLPEHTSTCYCGRRAKQGDMSRRFALLALLASLLVGSLSDRRFDPFQLAHHDCHSRPYLVCKTRHRTALFSRRNYSVFLQGRQKLTHHIVNFERPYHKYKTNSHPSIIAHYNRRARLFPVCKAQHRATQFRQSFGLFRNSLKN